MRFNLRFLDSQVEFKSNPKKTSAIRKRNRKQVQPANLWRSKRLKENDEKLAASSFHCKLCKKSFRREDIYVAHMLDHEPIDDKLPAIVPTQPLNTIAEDLFIDLFSVTIEENETKYQCRLCAHVFLDSQEAKNHQRIHDGSTSRYCGHCDKHFGQKDSFTKHLETHKGINSFECNNCGKCFASLDAISKHRLNSCNQIVFKCSICENEFGDQASLDLHEPCNTMGAVEFRCEPCGETFSVKTLFEEHLRSHKMQPIADSLNCLTCGIKVATKAEYDEHVKIHDYDIYGCHSCSETYNLLEDLEMHYQMSETCLEVVCSDCRTEFQCVSDLRKHLEEITTKADGSESEVKLEGNYIEVFICRFCQRGFHSHDPYLVHLKIHYSEKPKPCDICGEVFDTEAKLAIHYKFVHRSASKFPCIECGLVFLDKSQLKKHCKSVHAQDNVFKCLPCGRTFYLRLDFNRHVMTRQHNKRIVDAGLAGSIPSRVEGVRCRICEKIFPNNRELKRHQLQHQKIQSNHKADKLLNHDNNPQQPADDVSVYYNEAVYNFVDGEHVVLTTGDPQASTDLLNARLDIDPEGNIGIVYMNRGEEDNEETDSKTLKLRAKDSDQPTEIACEIVQKDEEGASESCNEEAFLALSEMVKQGKIDLSSLDVIQHGESK